jgi:hypothetical protein
MEKVNYTPYESTKSLPIVTGEVSYDGENIGIYQYHRFKASSCFCLQLNTEPLVYFDSEEEMSQYIIERMS